MNHIDLWAEEPSQPAVGSAGSSFKKDLKHGEATEDRIRAYLASKKCLVEKPPESERHYGDIVLKNRHGQKVWLEIKDDLKAKSTGNIYVEAAELYTQEYDWAAKRRTGEIVGLFKQTDFDVPIFYIHLFEWKGKKKMLIGSVRELSEYFTTVAHDDDGLVKLFTSAEKQVDPWGSKQNVGFVIDSEKLATQSDRFRISRYATVCDPSELLSALQSVVDFAPVEEDPFIIQSFRRAVKNFRKEGWWKKAGYFYFTLTVRH